MSLPLPHGREISSEELEMIAGREFPLKRFVSLCNSLVWATSKSKELTQASLTERVLVKDNGVDAEWTINLGDNARHGALLGQGWNVFQYKQRDISGSDRQHIVANLRAGLRGAAREVHARTQRRPDHYSLFTNIDLNHQEKQGLEAAIRNEFEDPLHVTIRGAADLAAALNDLPHLRSAFFSTARFSTWEHAWLAHSKASVIGSVPDLVGRNSDVEEIRVALEDDNIRVLAITGPSGIGKNRVSLEATAHRPLDTVIVLDAALGVADLLQIKRPGQNPVVIIDNPDEEQTDELIGAALGEDLKLVFTITDPTAAQQFNFGRDPRIRIFNLRPLSENDSQELLRKAGARLDYSVESWVLDKAAGNASVLIAAAAVGEELRVAGAVFLDQVGDRLESRCRTLLGENGIRMIRALSVMTAVGISGNVAEELPKLCGTLESLTPNDVLSNINQLTRSGFVRHVGNYLEVIPPVLANRSAALGLAGRETQLSTFLSALSPPGAARLLRRIQQLPENALRSFLHEPFHGGELSSFPKALQNIELLRLLAPAAPTQAIGLVEAGLTQMSIEERRQMEPGARRGVIWTIEELLFRQRTSAAALRSLSLLAEAETEQWGNNATHVFGECFYPLHPQFPLALNERISILREFVTNDATRERKLIAIGATRDAFNTHAVITLRRSSGPVPFDAVPQMTYAEVYDYWETLIDFLRRLMTDSDAEVVTEAGRAFIRAVGDFTIRGRQAGGVRMLEELLAPVVTASLPIRLEDYAETLNISYRGLQVNFPDESARVMELIGAIDKGNFDTRARRWIGSWDFGEQEKDEDGNLAFHSEIEIRKLAQDPATDSAVVSESLFQWLQSKEAKRAPEFFFWLGRRDEAGNWIREIDRRGETLEGELAFACYYGGRASISPDLADDKLEILTSAGLVRPEALLGATSYLPGSGRAVTRILELLRRGLSPLLAERRLMGGGWMKPLSASEAATLLRAIAGPGLENAAPVIDFLAMWVHSNKALEGELGELAWRALETAPKTGEPWDFDLVAATLLPGDLDRAFALLIGLLTLPSDLKRWEPLDRHGGNRFWNALWAADRRRCLVRLLEVGVGSPLARLRISWHLPEILDLEQDGEVLLDFARRDTASAEFVSSCLRASRPGFWPVALALLALDPENKVIRGNIANAAQHMGDVIAGPFSDHYNRCAAAVEEVLRTNNHPSTTRTFLRTLAEELRREAAREHREEDDESVNW